MDFKHSYLLFLVTLMLLMQSATIAHSIEHDLYEHTELCEIYLPAEKISALDVSGQLFFLNRHISTQAVSYFKKSYLSKRSTAYSSRAPPLS